jgi:hypothetical protein
LQKIIRKYTPSYSSTMAVNLSSWKYLLYILLRCFLNK